jgi:hypothetical protein
VRVLQSDVRQKRLELSVFHHILRSFADRVHKLPLRYIHPNCWHGRNAHTVINNHELQAELAKLEVLLQEERHSNRVTSEKLTALEAYVEEKVFSIKKADRVGAATYTLNATRAS